MMKRDECLKILAAHHTDEIVVAAYQAAFEWMVIKPDSLTYVSIGAMGQASSHALGLALGRSDKRIIVLDGDGSLLMNLGSLVTVAEVAPPNYLHFLCNNGTYESNGGHPIPGAGRVRFANFAREAGYASVYEFDDLEQFESSVASILNEIGPVFVNLEVERGADYPQAYEELHSRERRLAFKRSLSRRV